MRNIDPALASALASETATTCLCWRFTLADGRVFGATDHDQPVRLDNIVCQPDKALQAGEFSTHTELGPGQVVGAGGLSSGFLTATDLDNGVWNSARVDVFRSDWSDPSRRLQIWSGRIGEVWRDGERFRAELTSLKADLERPIGRVYARNCDAEIGDARCGADLTRPEYSGQGQIDAILSPNRFTSTDLQEFEEDWFTRGRLLWIDGANTGGQTRITGFLRQSSRAEIVLISPPGQTPVIGDTFRVTAGCDKTQDTCINKFSNIVNFRGFPGLPGNDVLLAGARGNKQ